MIDVPQRIEAVNATIAKMTEAIEAIGARQGKWSLGKEAAAIAIQIESLGRVVERLSMLMEVPAASE